MEASTHKVIAPIFTLGVATAYLTTSSPDLPLTLYGTVGLATVSSYFAACWPDADQHAKYMPLPVIWAGFTPITDTLLKPYGVKKIYKRVDSSGRQIRGGGKASTLYKGKKYPRIKTLSSRLWATVFRVTGLRKHRDWRSHSPLLWCPLWYWLYYIANMIPYLNIFLAPIVMGFGLGYISHLLGDAFTKSGVPFLPEFKVIEKIPVVNQFTEVKVFRGRFFKANNKLWNYMVILIIAEGALFLISPDLAKSVNSVIWNIVVAFYESIKNIIVTMLSN